MKKELLISRMAILSFCCVVLFSATAQAQLCMVMTSKSQCQAVPGCYWCATTGYCNPFPSCPTCNSMSIDTCKSSYGCKYCTDQWRCVPKLRPCTCGTVAGVQSPEQCDGGPNCDANCKCPAGYENDGGNGCKQIELPPPPLCGNGYLDPGEDCEPTARNCDPNTCECAVGYEPDPLNPGFCKAVQVCGNYFLESGEECELYSRNCVDCVCVGGTIPDPINLGWCYTPAFCGDGIVNGDDECDDNTPNCVACKCISPSIPEYGSCVTLNNPPVLETIGNKTVDEGGTLQFTVTATDPDNNDLTFETDTLPDGASFDTASQVFTWTPGYDQAGNYQVLFRVVDNGTPPLSASETITITVGNVNRPPELASIGDLDVKENQLLQFTVTATDPDLGDVLTYSASDLPDGASFGPNTQIFSWKPAYNQAGTYPVTFTVTDNGTPQESDSETIIITVGNINRPPKLDPIGNRTVNEGEKLEIVITATDPDGDRLTYSTSNLPAGATFDPIAQKFSWTPGYNQAGEYQVTFNVSDGEWSVSETITITVNHAVLQATIDINPDTLNLKSKGGENSMTVYIELPGGYDVRQIRVPSIQLNVKGKMISAQSAPTSIGDYDGDGFYDLMVKFDRQAVIAALGGRTGNISLTVTGKLNNGPEFTGSDTIKVINPGK